VPQNLLSFAGEQLQEVWAHAGFRLSKGRVAAACAEHLVVGVGEYCGQSNRELCIFIHDKDGLLVILVVLVPSSLRLLSLFSAESRGGLVHPRSVREN